MDLSLPAMTKKSSPVLTIKRAGLRENNGQWQDFIDREQSSVDHLVRDSFVAFCHDLKEKSTPKNYNHTIGGYKVRKNKHSPKSPEMSSPGHSPQKFNMISYNQDIHGSRTLPRMPKTLFKDQEDSDGLHLPPGIQELESLYAPMKNLLRPLPSMSHNYSDDAIMPLPHPLNNWNEVGQVGCSGLLKMPRDEDETSEICSVIIPPPLPPVQSHAVLEKSLGHELPSSKTPSRSAKFSTSSSAGSSTGPLSPPPVLPQRTNSKLSLQRSNKHSTLVHHQNIYANANSLNRSSLMSTGSSEESSGSSGLPDVEVTSPSVVTSEAVFSWPNYSINSSRSSPASSEEHRSVSQIGEAPESEASENSYVKMTGHSGETTYMNVIYSAVQRQGGHGSVENAISPYLEMTPNVRKLPNANVDAISAIYARPQSLTSSSSSKSNSSKKSSSSSSRKMSDFKKLMAEVSKKRQFRVGLNLFNTRPEVGIEYLASKGFLDLSAQCVGKFLFTTAGLSLEKVGDYLGSLQSPFAMKVLSCFMQEFNFSGQRIDKSLRLLLKYVRVPGEAQKIEKIMEVFGKRYADCNPNMVGKLKNSDSIVTLAFAVMLLNTDLHTPNLKSEKKMQVQDFINNLRGVDGGRDFDGKLLKQIYKGIKKAEFVTAVDHVVQTQALQQTILNQDGKPMNLSEHHRRLVCLCRLFEVTNINARKSSDASLHSRDLFLFNDLLIVAKQSGKGGKNGQQIYSQKQAFELRGLEVTLFHTPVFSHGIQVSRKSDGAVLVTLNAGSEHDRYKFIMDLQESIFEMEQMDEAAKNLSL